MSYFRKEDYSDVRERPNLLTNYMRDMKKFLKIRYPLDSDEKIEEVLKKVVIEKMKVPTINAVHHPREGESKRIEMPLTEYNKTIIKDNNLSPSGTCYLPVSTRESFLRISLEEKIAERNFFKKLYLDNAAQGNVREAQYYNHSQANAKIFNNAIAGGMNIVHFILGCKAGFNAITSIGRVSVKQGYSFIERALVANIYLPSVEAVISYIVTHARHVHRDFEKMMHTYGLYQPTCEDLLGYLLKSLKNYVFKPKTALIRSTIEGLTDTERAYVYYAGCLKNLCEKNDSLLRELIDGCFVQGEVDQSLYAHYDLGDLGKFNGDIIACVLSTNFRRLGQDPTKPDRWYTLKDAKKENPNGVKEFIYCCDYFKNGFERLVPILTPIVQIDVTFSKLTFQDKIARHCVILSDTDSNIFSCQEIVKWKRKDLDFSQESYEMNAITTFILSQSLEHVFARLSAGFGVEGKDVFRISMKNEFLYPVLLSTSLAKHYLAIATMQEGSLLPDPRKDIKGVGFRSSTYPKIIRDGFDKFYVDFVKKVMSGEPLYASYILDHVAKLEKEVHRSISDRESVYLQTVSVKRKEDYKDADSSTYFYYELWNAVFAEEYGDMIIPNKCFKIPLISGDKFTKNKAVLDMIARKYPTIYPKLIKFIEDNPSRKFSSILVPPFKGSLNPFFVDVMDLRAHVSQVMTAYYNMLDGLGIGTVDRRPSALVSDFYTPLS